MRIAACLVCLAGLYSPAAAEEGTPVRRHVIVLVGSPHPDGETEDVAHQLLELPLNHCGMVVRRHSIDDGPPPAAWLEDARAVITHFDPAAKANDWLWPWLEKAVARHRLRVIHFGELTPLEQRGDKRLRRWLARRGLAYDRVFLRDAVRIRVRYRAKETCAFEADPRIRTTHRGPKNISPRNRVWVETRDRFRPDDARAPVVTGPWGGLALDPWAVTNGGTNQERRWHIDPFLFFREALGVDGVPAPHPSVLNGRRMWFLHIDGDGFESLSTVRPNTYAARIMLDDVLLRYRLPFTVSIIVRSLTPDYAIEKPTRAMELARRILNLPHVEPASHGVLHTLRWKRDLKPTDPPRTIMWYGKLENYEYSQLNEVRESVRFVNERLMEGGRRCALMLWTGDTIPGEDVIAAAGEAACLNLNGGDFRWDRWYDSVGFVSPWSRRVGDALQVYAGATNENMFDGFFTTMPGAFAQIDETIERTGSPRILKPANIYVHFYSAERPPRLRALHDLIQRWGLKEPTAPVFASAYCRAVISAVETARARKIRDGWLLRDFGDCRTARIDEDPRDVDFARSRGLLGARRIRDSLYLHLAAPDAKVVLAADPAPAPHVEEANCFLETGRLTPDGVTVTATAHNPRLVVFAGFPAHAPLQVLLDGEEQERSADGRGRLRIALDEPGTTRIAVRLR
ncbi:MAG: polysaccharide deacetylase family protein [Planctomycetota bacterium]